MIPVACNDQIIRNCSLLDININFVYSRGMLIRYINQLCYKFLQYKSNTEHDRDIMPDNASNNKNIDTYFLSVAKEPEALC